MPDEVVYQVYNMYGPTVFTSGFAGFEKLCEKTQYQSRNAGLYRIIYLPSGEVVAAFRDGEMISYHAQGGRINV